MLKTFVIGHLRHPSKFVRARAAWCIKQYSESCLFQTDALAKIIDSLVHRLGDQNERMLVKVESALTIQCLLKHQEKVHALMRPSVGVVIVKVLELLAKTKIMAVVYVIDELLEQYNEDIVPIASEVAEHLCHIYLELLGTFTFGESPAHIFFGIPNTFRKIIAKGHMVTLVKVEGSVVKVVDAMLETAPTFYREALRLLQSILHSYVSDPLWGVLDHLYDVFKEHDGIYVLPSFELGQVLHLYIVTHTESFLAFPHRVAVVLDMCITTMKLYLCLSFCNCQIARSGLFADVEDERRLYATKIMECILFECSSHNTEVIPTILMTMFERLTKPFEEGMNLKPHVVVAALYMNLDVSLQALHQIAPDPSNLLECICDEFFTCYKKMKGIHDKRMALIGICLYFQLPPSLRPSLISTNPKKVLKVSLSIFEKLLQERKLVAQKKNEESETNDSGEESNDEADRKVPKIVQCHRKVHETEHLSDDEDEIDEVTLDHMDTAVKEESRADGDVEDGDLESATESLPFEEVGCFIGIRFSFEWSCLSSFVFCMLSN
ncbi:unnamed protein product [Angiostrongylus costaricensis]|uniref:Integrator complex subunit 7 n=1 Tax=Angiostrongylus costaricensis TaxID=334426 RepID=A0A0R3PDX7_ANGCS|nr:unnamed protein product [Angiostrongylus costaricensis]